jgi:hypothetical protein
MGGDKKRHNPAGRGFLPEVFGQWPVHVKSLLAMANHDDIGGSNHFRMVGRRCCAAVIRG